MPRPDMSEVQRAAILAGARQAFARKGATTTMADVAAAAGVSQGLAYRYFSSKEEIYRSLLSQAVAQAEQATASDSEPPSTPGQRLRWLITRIVEYRRDHLELFQLLDLVVSSDASSDDISEDIRRRGERFAAHVRELIAAGQATGEVRSGDPDQLTVALLASLEGLTRFGVHHPEQFQAHCPDPEIFLRMLLP
jgi:AcrR family transcriptional regulator